MPDHYSKNFANSGLSQKKLTMFISPYRGLSALGRATVQSPFVREKPELHHSDLFSLEDLPGAPLLPSPTVCSGAARCALPMQAAPLVAAGSVTLEWVWRKSKFAPALCAGSDNLMRGLGSSCELYLPLAPGALPYKTLLLLLPNGPLASASTAQILHVWMGDEYF